MHVLNALKYKPDIVIFVDDKVYNLQSVDDVLKNTDTVYRLFRHSCCDEYVNNYDHGTTQKLLEEFLLQHPLTADTLHY